MSYIGQQPADRILTSADISDAAITADKLASSSSVTQPKVATSVAGTGPAFSAQNGAGNSVGNATNVKITFGATANFDTNSNYSTANSKFQPTVAGYYQINANCQLQGGGSGFYQTKLYKNGSSYDNGCLINCIQYAISTISSLVYMNGSTDYLEIYAVQTSGSTQTITGLAFNGSMVRAA